MNFLRNLSDVYIFGIQLLLISTICAEPSELKPPDSSTADPTKLNINTQISNDSIKNEIISEGGKLSTSTTLQPQSNFLPHHGRENVEDINETVLPEMNTSPLVTASLPELEMSPSQKANDTKLSVNSTSPPPRIIPIYENVTIDDKSNSSHKNIVPRKGVNFTEDMAHTSKRPIIIPAPTSPKPKPLKPLITKGSDEEPYASSHFQGKSKSNTSNAQNIPRVPLESDQGQKYLVPIVIVILSVPFVAILTSIIYKRGTEWWQHRHYRRMDFLINGIYDN